MIILQKFEPQDIPRLISWITDEKFLLQWAGPKYHFPLDEIQLLKTYAGTQGENPEQYMFKVLHQAKQEVVGHIELLAIDYQQKSAVLGRILIGAPTQRGKGYGERMIKAGLMFGFEELGLNEIELGVFEFNQAAINCYQKLGFREYKSVEYNTTPGDEFKILKRMRLKKENWK